VAGSALSVAPDWSSTYLSSRVSETTSGERKALEKNFRATHEHPTYGGKYLMHEIHWLANVSRRQFDGWRRAEKKYSNNLSPGKRILDLIERNKPTKNPRNLPPRKREDWLT